MLSEIDAAIAYLRTLFGEDRSTATQPAWSFNALEAFSESLRGPLIERYGKCWYAEQPERGSASRAMHWHAHLGGEGVDEALVAACEAARLCVNQTEKSFWAPNSLPSPFTLWVDPGCVAVRAGRGPGVSADSADAHPDQHIKLLERSGTINLIWGELPRLHSPELQRHHLSSTSPSTSAPIWQAPAKRPIPIINPDERFVPRARPGHPAGHGRSPSLASVASSSAGSLSRSASLSGSASGEESDSCPSLISNSNSNSSAGSDGESEGCGVAFEGAFDDEEEVGDVTIRPSDLVFDFDAPTPVKAGSILNKEADIMPMYASEQFHQPHFNSEPPAFSSAFRAMHQRHLSSQSNDGRQGYQASSTPRADCAPTMHTRQNYSVHDNGNVGVLGGGVRLGGVPSSRPQQTISRPSSLYNAPIRHGHSQSLSYGPPMYAPPKMDHTFYQGAAIGSYSAPMRTVPLPVMSEQQYPFRAQEQILYHGLPPHVPFHGAEGPMARVQLPLGMINPNTYADPSQQEDMMKDGQSGKRVRSRGRRSRGRGAGRAARRQAAALKALAESGVLDLDALNSSRTGTPTPSSMASVSGSSVMSTPCGSVSGKDADMDAAIVQYELQRADSIKRELVRRHLEQQLDRECDIDLASLSASSAGSCTQTPRPGAIHAF